jgi:serralysin
VDLTAGVSSGSHGADTLASIENVDGSPGHDVLIGDEAPNRLRTYAGLDRLDGRNGDDVLRGGGGNDRLDGGRGIDDCIGEILNRCD